MTLDEAYVKLQAKLSEEAGTSDWWTEAEIKEYYNNLYQDTCEELQLIKVRDETTVTVAEQKSYDLPVPTGYDRGITLLGVDCDGIPLDGTSVVELDRDIYKWREFDSGTPAVFYHDLGEDGTKVSLFRKPTTADLVLGIEQIMIPSELADAGSPLYPFTNGKLLKDGVMAMALYKSGGGRDLDRGNWYWQQYISGLAGLTQRRMNPNRERRLGSIENTVNRGFNLGERYPSYPK